MGSIPDWTGAQELQLLSPHSVTTEAKSLEPVLHKKSHCSEKPVRHN